MIYNLVVFICGFLFGTGLTISSIINPNKILGFLDITGDWDPSLAFIMLSAVTVTWLGYRFILRLAKPKLANTFCLPQKTAIDTPLILGAMLFGIGWGLAGYCPGPAFTALGLGIMDAVYFMIGMMLSVAVYHFLSYVLKNK